MGQKVHPESLRVGYIHDWKSNWFNEREFADYLQEDIRIREHIQGRLAHAGLSDITIRKNKAEITVNINTARPGIVIGKSGIEVDALRRDLHDMTHKQVKVNILEIKRPELDAKLVAQSIAEQLENRVAFRRAMKRALTSAMRSGAKGVRVQVAGRLGGAEMARTQGYSDGRVPLHTLRADIDYGFTEAKTTFGRIGVKCWINKGEIMPAGYKQKGEGPAKPSSERRLAEADEKRGDRAGRGAKADSPVAAAREESKAGAGDSRVDAEKSKTPAEEKPAEEQKPAEAKGKAGEKPAEAKEKAKEKPAADAEEAKEKVKEKPTAEKPAEAKTAGDKGAIGGGEIKGSGDEGTAEESEPAARGSEAGARSSEPAVEESENTTEVEEAQAAGDKGAGEEKDKG